MSVLLEVAGVSKAYPGVQALTDVTLDIHPGEVHCLVGANGAGKSTLIKIIMGAATKDVGEVRFENRRVSFHSPAEAHRVGIACIYQEPDLIPFLTVVENIFLAHEPVRSFGALDHRRMRQEATALLATIGVELPLDLPVNYLSISQRQLVALAKALSFRPRLIIMDEPTSALTQHEVERLFTIIRRMQSEGVATLYISHRLEEIFTVGDRVTVLRDGHVIATHQTSRVAAGTLISQMIGRSPSAEEQVRERTPNGSLTLSVQGLRIPGRIEDVHFDARRGEILGLFGMVGAGKSEVLEALVGIRPASGTVQFQGRPVQIRDPHHALALGIALLPEDRKRDGLFLDLTVLENIALPSYDRFQTRTLLHFGDAARAVFRFVQSLGIVTPSLYQSMRNLSGGNQQKGILARWLVKQCSLLLMDEPTRGIDVSSKAEIHRLIRDLCGRGLTVVLASSEVDEIAQVADRVLVMFGGRIVREFPAGASPHEMLLAAMGGA